MTEVQMVWIWCQSQRVLARREERGAGIAEYLAIVALALIAIGVVFAILSPAFRGKATEIRDLLK